MAADTSDTLNLNLGFYELSMPSNINPQSMLRLATMAGVEEGNLPPSEASDVAMKALNSKASSINGVGQARAWIKIAIKNAYEAVTGIHIPSQFNEDTQAKIYRAFQTSFWRNVHNPRGYGESLRNEPNNELIRLTGITSQQIGEVIETLKDKFYDTREGPKPHDNNQNKREVLDPCYELLGSIISNLEGKLNTDKVAKLFKEYFELRTERVELSAEKILEMVRKSPFCANEFFVTNSHPFSRLDSRIIKQLLSSKVAFEVENDFGPNSIIFDPVIYAHSCLSYILSKNSMRKILKDPELLKQLRLLKSEWNNL